MSTVHIKTRTCKFDQKTCFSTFYQAIDSNGPYFSSMIVQVLFLIRITLSRMIRKRMIVTCSTTKSCSLKIKNCSSNLNYMTSKITTNAIPSTD